MARKGPAGWESAAAEAVERDWSMEAAAAVVEAMAVAEIGSGWL